MRDVTGIDRREVRGLIERVADRAPIMGNRVLALIRKMLNFAVDPPPFSLSDWDQIPASPKLNRSRVTRVLHSGSVARRLFIAAIIALLLGAPIAEMFDRWDQTMKDGNDTEANVVVAALCIGVAFAIGTLMIASRIRALSSTAAGRVIDPHAVLHDVASAFGPVPTVSPPTVLRI